MQRSQRMIDALHRIARDDDDAEYRSAFKSKLTSAAGALLSRSKHMVANTIWGPEYENPKISYVMDCGSDHTKLTFDAIAAKGFQVGCTTQDAQASAYSRKGRKKQPSRPLVGKIVTSDRFALAYSVGNDAKSVYSSMGQLEQQQVLLIFNRRDMTGQNLMVNSFKHNMLTCFNNPPNPLYHVLKPLIADVEAHFLKENILCFLMSLQKICRTSFDILKLVQKETDVTQDLSSLSVTMAELNTLFTNPADETVSAIFNLIVECDRLFKIRHSKKSSIRDLCVAQDASILVGKIEEKMSSKWGLWRGVLRIWADFDGLVKTTESEGLLHSHWTDLLALADASDRIMKSVVQIQIARKCDTARMERNIKAKFDSAMRKEIPSRRNIKTSLTAAFGELGIALAGNYDDILIQAMSDVVAHCKAACSADMTWEECQAATSQLMLNERGVKAASYEIAAFAEMFRILYVATNDWKAVMDHMKRENPTLKTDNDVCAYLGECIPVKDGKITLETMVKQDFSTIPELETFRVRAKTAYTNMLSELNTASTHIGSYAFVQERMFAYIHEAILAQPTVDPRLLAEIVGPPPRPEKIGQIEVEWQKKYLQMIVDYNKQVMINGVSTGSGKGFIENTLHWFLDAACGEYIMGGIEVFGGKEVRQALQERIKPPRKKRDSRDDDESQQPKKKRRHSETSSETADAHGTDDTHATDVDASFHDTGLTLKEYVNMLKGTKNTCFPMNDAYMLLIAFRMNMAGTNMQQTLDAHKGHPIATIVQAFLATSNMEAHQQSYSVGDKTQGAMSVINRIPFGSMISDCVVSPSMKMLNFAKTQDLGWLKSWGGDVAHCMMRHPLKILLLSSAVQGIRIFQCCKYYLSDLMDDPLLRAKAIDKIVSSLIQKGSGMTYIVIHFTTAFVKVLFCIYKLYTCLWDAKGAAKELTFAAMKRELLRFIRQILDCITSVAQDILVFGQWAFDLLLNWIRYFLDTIFTAIFDALEAMFGSTVAGMKKTLIAMLDETLGFVLGVSFHQVSAEDARQFNHSVSLLSSFANEFAFTIIARTIVPKVCKATWFLALPIWFGNIVKRLCYGSINVVTTTKGLGMAAAGSGALMYFVPVTAGLVGAMPVAAAATGGLTIKMICRFILTPLLFESEDSEDFMTEIDFSTASSPDETRTKKLMSLVSLGAGSRIMQGAINTTATIAAAAVPKQMNDMANFIGLPDVVSTTESTRLRICPSLFRALLIVQNCLEGAGLKPHDDAMILFTTIMTVTGMRKTDTAILLRKLMTSFMDSEVAVIMEPFQFIAFLTAMNTVGQLLLQTVSGIACHIATLGEQDCFCGDVKVYADEIRRRIHQDEAMQNALQEMQRVANNTTEYAQVMASTFENMGEMRDRMTDAVGDFKAELMENVDQLHKNVADFVDMEAVNELQERWMGKAGTAFSTFGQTTGSFLANAGAASGGLFGSS